MEAIKGCLHCNSIFDDIFDEWRDTIQSVSSKIDHLEEKRTQTKGDLSRQIVDSLRAGQSEQELTVLRVELLIKQEMEESAHKLIHCYCERLDKRLKYILRQREILYDLRPEIGSLSYAASKCYNIPELNELRAIFEDKFGTEIVRAATNLEPGNNVNEKMISWLATQPTLREKLQRAQIIAKKERIDWHYHSAWTPVPARIS